MLNHCLTISHKRLYTNNEIYKIILIQNMQALYRRSSKCSKTKPKTLVVYKIQNLQVRLASGPVHNIFIV